MESMISLCLICRILPFTFITLMNGIRLMKQMREFYRYARGILFGKMVLELGDSSIVRNNQTGMSCDVEFKTKVRSHSSSQQSPSLEAHCKGCNDRRVSSRVVTIPLRVRSRVPKEMSEISRVTGRMSWRFTENPLALDSLSLPPHCSN